MKKIEAIIRPNRVDAVKRALISAGCRGITVISALGHGRQHGMRQRWRLRDYVVDLLPKAMVVVVVRDQEVDAVLDVIAQATRTDMIGDGKVFVSPVSDALRIRTGERGVTAL